MSYYGTATQEVIAKQNKVYLTNYTARFSGTSYCDDFDFAKLTQVCTLPEAREIILSVRVTNPSVLISCQLFDKFGNQQGSINSEGVFWLANE